MITPPRAGGLDFELPAELIAREPPEIRARSRADVRLLVSAAEGQVAHFRFRGLPKLLRRGDLLVVNSSATIGAALHAHRTSLDEPALLHLSTRLSRSSWAVELRRVTGKGAAPLFNAHPGERLLLAGDVSATLRGPYRPVHGSTDARARLWIADFHGVDDIMQFAARHGAPIRYDYVTGSWPLEYYQTIFATEPGSAEMPSAGRPFTWELVDALGRTGVGIASLVLHTGVSSLETDEPPYPERYRVPPATADAVHRTRSSGGRVIAVGTSVVRALETASDIRGRVRARQGWTDLVIDPAHPVRAIDGLLTGFHAPRASHLVLLEAVATPDAIAHAYRQAITRRYLWHEFGDVHLIFRSPGFDALGLPSTM